MWNVYVECRQVLCGTSTWKEVNVYVEYLCGMCTWNVVKFYVERLRGKKWMSMWNIYAECVRGMSSSFMWNVYVERSEFLCGMSMWNVYVECLCGMMWILLHKHSVVLWERGREREKLSNYVKEDERENVDLQVTEVVWRRIKVIRMKWMISCHPFKWHEWYEEFVQIQSYSKEMDDFMSLVQKTWKLFVQLKLVRIKWIISCHSFKWRGRSSAKNLFCNAIIRIT